MKLKDRKKMFKDARIARQTDIDQLLINISNQIVTQKSLLDDIKSFKKIYLKNISYNQKLFSELNKKKKRVIESPVSLYPVIYQRNFVRF
tara:strand:- start:4377 stop:4646 length:270 start_codon:yes stop_codon:yes gene_type:complete